MTWSVHAWAAGSPPRPTARSHAKCSWRCIHAPRVHGSPRRPRAPWAPLAPRTGSPGLVRPRDVRNTHVWCPRRQEWPGADVGDLGAGRADNVHRPFGPGGQAPACLPHWSLGLDDSGRAQGRPPGARRASGFLPCVRRAHRRAKAPRELMAAAVGGSAVACGQRPPLTGRHPQTHLSAHR